MNINGPDLRWAESTEEGGLILLDLQIIVTVSLLLNILQDSSFSNQITVILPIQGVFNLPGRGFRQCVTSTSPVPMTLNDIVHMRQFVIALVSVDGCSSFPDQDGFLDMPELNYAVKPEKVPTEEFVVLAELSTSLPQE